MDTRTERELPFFVSVGWLVVVLPASVTMFAPLALGLSVITLVGATVLYLGVGIGRKVRGHCSLLGRKVRGHCSLLGGEDGLGRGDLC